MGSRVMAIKFSIRQEFSSEKGWPNSRQRALAGTSESGTLAPLVTNRATLISASIVPDDPALMEVPAGYREMESFQEAANANTNQFATNLLDQARPLRPPQSVWTNTLTHQFE